ncbi:hypothetical protein PF005_g5433 [Phytophthora fragariae]|uniref:Uncharacterized protein n=1 Tax=Phytophthora fragariae TaxID=53985 RepID=A0A6A4EG03_9STRA|nr:hypothetical protein PF003_g20949 [Phytophthora fragariae]KAE8948663.1 hypothetical protein PF009_g1775 [Phytophthora fragariae]KAE9022851.1 hypothetical protein PF011_g4255 [Phytophthora fragariae]KAE9127686.1 hypothetical protein PF007_g5522 [Phytophthora fragariae]KAE9128019.1 hypothetical protein PF010_g4659 [Phytophthora fragariae]
MVNRTEVRLLNVQYAENLERNIISYGLLEKKGFKIENRDPHRVIDAMAGETAVFNVQMCNNVLVARAEKYDRGKSAGCMLMSGLAANQAKIWPDVEADTLMHFHLGWGISTTTLS